MNNPQSASPQLSADDLAMLREMVDRAGVNATACEMGMSRHALTGLLAGTRVRAGTVALATMRCAVVRASASARAPSSPPPSGQAA